MTFRGDDAAVVRAQGFWTRMGLKDEPPWTVHLDVPTTYGPDDLLLTDGAGVPLRHSQELVVALRRHTGRVSVALSDRSGNVLSAGVVGTRRSVSRTVTSAQRVAGPLAVMAVSGSPRRLPAARAASPAQLLSANIAATGWSGMRLARAAVTYREWACARIASPDLSGPGLQVLGDWHSGPHRFWADPFVLVAEDRTWLFMEELDRATGRGHIIAARAQGDRLLDARVVMRTPHHLSFPQIYRVGQRWLATLETCARHNPVYEFDEPGDQWRECTDFPALPPHTADAVADFDTGTLVGTDASTDGDSVLVRYSLREGTWVPEPAAVRVDVGWSRGGGVVDVRRAIRAVQDCSGTYGLAVGLTDSGDPDRHLTRWSAADLTTRGWSGVHTITWDRHQQQVWIDGWRRRLSALGWRARLIELSHLRRCQG